MEDTATNESRAEQRDMMWTVESLKTAQSWLRQGADRLSE